jgi:RNA-directed DNA polymerase
VEVESGIDVLLGAREGDHVLISVIRRERADAGPDHELNSTLRGWANYHRHVVASEAFSRIDTHVFERLWRMVRRRHSGKSAQWLTKQYWSAAGKGVFAIKAKTAKAKEKVCRVLRVSAVKTRRYVKIKADANPYLPEHAGYFWRRRNKKDTKLLPALSARAFRGMMTA